MTGRLRRTPFPELGLFGMAAVLMFAYDYLDKLAREERINPLVPLIEQGTGVMMAGVLFFAVRRLARVAPMTRDAWASRIVLHVVALVVFSVVHTTLNWVSREALFRVVGLGDYDYGVMRIRYLMEFPIDVILYTCFVVGVWSVDRWRAERRRAIEAAALHARLAEARLQNLHLQLQPHFLFNALNTVSSVMYEDPAAADTMLSRLADLLRYALGTADVHEVPLATELEALDHYLALVQARFGENFQWTIDVEPAARSAAVPALILQPLVENAVRHGGLSRIGRGRLRIACRRADDRLRIAVIDDDAVLAADARTAGAQVMGDAVAGALATPVARLATRAATTTATTLTTTPADTLAAASRDGVGLAATGERLRLLYGDAHHFAAGPVSSGGFHVRIDIPWRAAVAS